MASKLYFVEGLPGSGKSTFSYSLMKQLSDNGYDTVYYKEETSQPVDLFRQAIIPVNTFESILGHLSAKTVESVRENSYMLCDYAVVAYTKTVFSDQESLNSYQIFHDFDIGDGRVPFSTYKEYHYILWREFIRNYGHLEKNFITEGSFLHNQLLDIIGFYSIGADTIISYFVDLANIINRIPKKVYLIYPDNIEKLIEKTLIERGVGLHTWGEGFAKWMEMSPYCSKNNLKFKSGMVNIYQKMRQLSIQILNEIGWNYTIIERLIV